MFSHPWIHTPNAELIGLSEVSTRISAVLRPTWRYAWDRRVNSAGSPLWVSGGELSGRSAAGAGGASNPKLIGEGVPGYSTDGNDYFVLSNFGDFRYPAAVSFWWLRPTGTNSFPICIHSSITIKFNMMFLVAGASTILFTDGINIPNNIPISGAEIPKFNVWNNIVFQTDSNMWQYYLNGSLVKSGIFPIALSITPTASQIFRRIDSGSHSGNGSRGGDFLMYNRLLDSSEIKWYYESTRHLYRI